MTDEKDPVLTRMFAAEADAEPTAAFSETVRRRIVTLRRRRLLALLAATAAIPAAAALTAPLFATATLLGGSEGWLASPAAMAAGVGLALGLTVASRSRMRRR
jgi:hypothetical protein